MKPISLFTMMATCLACAITPVVPHGGASTLQVDPELGPEARQVELDKRRMTPTVIVRVRVTTNRRTKRTRIRRSVDRSALGQDGHNFSLTHYLSTLQVEGIATDVVDPVPFIQKGQQIYALWVVGGTVLGLGALGQAAVLDKNGASDTLRNVSAFTGVGMLLGGHIVGWIKGRDAALPGIEALQRARRERGAWSDTFNKGLADKLGLSGVAAKPAANAEGVLFVPVRKQVPSEAPTRERYK
jgi:hypothetical protein